MVVPVDQLINANPNKKSVSLYTLVLALARRATELSGGSASLVKTASKKSSTIALEEFREGKASFEKES